MATYEELYGLIGNPVLFMKFSMAISHAVNGIRREDSSILGHDRRLAWAKSMLGLPKDKVMEVLILGLTAQSFDSAVNIVNYPDDTIQFIVDGLVDYLVV